MTISPFDSRLFGALFGDDETRALFSDEAQIAAMVAVERALARAGARCGVIPHDAAAAIDAGLDGVAPPPETLAAGTAAAGVPVPALVDALRTRLDPAAGQWLHWGATSQDILDTALVLRLDRALARFGERLDFLIATLEGQAARWRDLPMAGRTRSQIAAPITFGHRIARWAQPLIALRGDLDVLRPRVARVQFGGSVGTNGAIAPDGPRIAAALAGELGLACSQPWHTDRTALAALANWCAALCAALAKMAGDLIVMGRGEIGEASAEPGGGSSTMPQKSNPVAAETMLALGRHAAALATPMHLAAIHAEERDGSAWALEWLALPQIVMSAGAALCHAQTLAAGIVPDPARMRRGLELGGGAAMAETASFLLARHMPRADAQSLVKAALSAVSETGESLADALTRLAPGEIEIDWTRALDPQTATAPAADAADAVFAAAHRPAGGSDPCG